MRKTRISSRTTYRLIDAGRVEGSLIDRRRTSAGARPRRRRATRRRVLRACPETPTTYDDLSPRGTRRNVRCHIDVQPHTSGLPWTVLLPTSVLIPYSNLCPCRARTERDQRTDREKTVQTQLITLPTARLPPAWVTTWNIDILCGFLVTDHFSGHVKQSVCLFVCRITTFKQNDI